MRHLHQQDVYGDPGDPKFRFYSLPAWGLGGAFQ